MIRATSDTLDFRPRLADFTATNASPFDFELDFLKLQVLTQH